MSDLQCPNCRLKMASNEMMQKHNCRHQRAPKQELMTGPRAEPEQNAQMNEEMPDHRPEAQCNNDLLVKCDICGQNFKERGLAIHKGRMHPAAAVEGCSALPPILTTRGRMMLPTAAVEVKKEQQQQMMPSIRQTPKTTAAISSAINSNSNLVQSISGNLKHVQQSSCRSMPNNNPLNNNNMLNPSTSTSASNYSNLAFDRHQSDLPSTSSSNSGSNIRIRTPILPIPAEVEYLETVERKPFGRHHELVPQNNAANVEQFAGNLMNAAVRAQSNLNELDKIATGGGKIWTIQLDTLLVDEPLLKFFRSIEPKFLLGNELFLNSIQCSGKCFREMFSDGLFSPLTLHLNHMDKIELDWKQNEFSTILNEIPALRNVRNMYLHDSLVGTYSGKRTPNLCPYFYDKKAILDYMHLPWHKPDNWPSYGEKYKPEFEGTARKLSIDLEWMGGGIRVEEMAEECKKRMNMHRLVRQDEDGKKWIGNPNTTSSTIFTAAAKLEGEEIYFWIDPPTTRTSTVLSTESLESEEGLPEPAVSYSIEIFSPDAKLGYDWLSGGTQARISLAGNEVFAVEPQHSSAMRPDGLPAYFATVIQRMGREQFAKTELGQCYLQQHGPSAKGSYCNDGTFNMMHH